MNNKPSVNSDFNDRGLAVPPHFIDEDWKTRLKDRGILSAALNAGVTGFDWESTPGMAIPLFNEDGTSALLPDGRQAQHWKNLNSEARPKYRFGYPGGKAGENKPQGLDTYFLPEIDLDAAIVDAGYALNIACGEPDAWTLVQVGIPNVISFLGEKNIPAHLIDFARRHSVLELRYYADLDTTGQAAAAALANRLKGSGIRLQLYQLPSSHNNQSIKDINDLYRALDCNSEVFRNYLDRLPCESFDNADEDLLLSRPSQDKRPEARLNSRSDSGKGHDQLPPRFYEALERKMGVRRYKSNGWSNPISCPFKDHPNDGRTPAAAWNRDMHILRCFKCGKTRLAIDVGGTLGIDWHDYIDRPAAHSKRSTNSSKGSSAQTGSLDDSRKARPIDPTDDELGNHLIEQWHGDVQFFYEGWYHYRSGVWEKYDGVPGAIWDAMIAFKEEGIRPTKSKAASILSYLETRLQVDDDLVNQGTNFINLRNGLYALATGQLEPHRRELYLTVQLPFVYRPVAECLAWEHFLSQIIVQPNGEEDQALRDLLHEALGYSLSADTHFEAGFFLLGQPASGKSTLLKVLQALSGKGYISVDLNALDRNSYQLADIAGKRVLGCTEMRANSKFADAILKPLISGEEIVVRQIYGQTFRLKPQVKLWWLSNELAENPDHTGALARRMKIIPFNHPIPEAQRDPRLIDKLLNELPGIFNRAVDGYRRLQANRGFTQVDQVISAVEEFQAANDLEAAFLDDQEWCIREVASETSGSDLYHAYRMWCLANGHKAKSNTRVAADWKRLGMPKLKSGVIRYQGVKLTPGAMQKVTEGKTSA